MKNSLIICPSCNTRLHVSKLSCSKCGLEVNGNFEIPLLSEEDYQFIKDFIVCEGNIQKMRSIYDATYKGIKDRIQDIKEKMGVEDMCKKREVEFIENEASSKVVKRLQDKIKECGGKGYMPALKGDEIPFWLTEDQSGFEVRQLKGVVFTFEMFDSVVKRANELGGKMYRGDVAAQNGKKLGSAELSYETIDGYIASKYFFAETGQKITRRSTYIAGILAWAGIATNHKSDGVGGYILISPLFKE